MSLDDIVKMQQTGKGQRGSQQQQHHRSRQSQPRGGIRGRGQGRAGRHGYSNQGARRHLPYSNGNNVNHDPGFGFALPDGTVLVPAFQMPVPMMPSVMQPGTVHQQPQQQRHPSKSVFQRLSYGNEQPHQHQQQHQQQQKPRGAAPGTQQQPNLAARELHCQMDETTGAVIIQFKDTTIVEANQNGDITLSSGGARDSTTLQALNAALQPINMKVVAVGEQWNVSDGRSLQRFSDGMTVLAKGPFMAGRAQALLQAFGSDDSTVTPADATAASTAAAVAAGLLPPGVGPPGIVGSAVMPVAAMAGAAAFNANGQSDNASRMQQRLKAQGRWAPY